MSERSSGGAEFFAGLVIGGLVGAALALLLAPQSGEETRAQLRDRSLEYKDRAEESILEARQKAEQQIAALQDQVSRLQHQVAELQE
ncbi:MAG: YtxH domain-containing protein, partial [Chloroflexi bacterium]